MKQIKFKEIKLIPPKNTVYVVKVSLESEKNIYIPNLKKTSKTEEFGEVVYSHDKQLIGKIITVDPWRTTPTFIAGKEYHRITSEDGFTEVEIIK